LQRRFLDILGRQLAARSLTGKTDPRGTMVVDLRELGSVSVDLMGLARNCSSRGPEEWPFRIATVLDAVAAHTRTPLRTAPRVSFSDAEPSLLISIYPEGMMPPDIPVVSRQLAPGVKAYIHCRHERASMFVAPADAERWGRGPDQLFEIATRNLRRLPKLRKLAQRVMGVDLIGIFPYDEASAIDVAARLLVLEDYLSVRSPHGVLVGLPSIAVILCHEITGPMFNLGMAILRKDVEIMYKKAAGPLSRDLYWWKEGKLRPLPSADAGDDFGGSLPGEFLDSVVTPLLGTSKAG
jgi:hypothetical protein